MRPLLGSCVEKVPDRSAPVRPGDRRGKTLKLDLLPASPVIMQEGEV